MLGLKIIATGFGHDGADHNYPCPVDGGWVKVALVFVIEKRKFLKRLRYIVEDQNVYDDEGEKIPD